MHKKIKVSFLLLFVLIITINSYSQNNFEKGYFISNQGNKTECLIKNMGWLNNPMEFEYKNNENSKTQKGDLNNVKEFAIYNSYYFKRYTVKIDYSNNDLRNLSNKRTPVFKEEKLFLKLIFQGEETALYEFSKNRISRYFYETPIVPIQQLIYKRYLTNGNKILENNRFRQQLWTTLKCENITLNSIKKVKYSRGNLIDFFENHNNCKGFSNQEIASKKPKEIINVNIRPRINSSSLSMDKGSTLLTYARSVDFGNKTSFGLGIELEYILPFNNNKWGLLIEPSYISFKGEKRLVYNSGFSETNFIADFKLLELPLGIRHYLFLNDNSKIFLNATYNFNLNLNSSIYDEENKFSSEFKASPNPNISFGLGYNHKNTYCLEFRLGIKKEVLKSSQWTSDLNTISIIIGYNLFNKK
ncbi:hypothetical protein [Wocania ichthyoenteri]|uniref:hypothetical protein n=1 Tax=Wocania ichthyoenteri TaxID=1230531 RepID=UPI0006917210|nr:hypothetical protein [Wocania ichthyoenteri]